MTSPYEAWGFSPLTVDLIRRAEAILAETPPLLAHLRRCSADLHATVEDVRLENDREGTRTPTGQRPSHPPARPA
jgi:hypothetical protein